MGEAFMPPKNKKAALQTKTATPTGTEFELTPDEGFDGLSAVTVEGDANLSANNIKDGVTIYGVQGVLVEDAGGGSGGSGGGSGGNLQEGSATPTGEDFTLLPDEGYDGFSSVDVVGDHNLTPENIATGITIYGVTGTMSTAPASTPPSEYDSIITEARTYYAGEYANAMVLESNNFITVGFLMDDFVLTDYDSATTEFWASGWVRVGYNKTTDTWSSVDFTVNASEGGNYISNVRYSSCYILYGQTVVYPVNTYNAVVGDGSTALAYVVVESIPGYTITLTNGTTTLTANYLSNVKQMTFAIPYSGTWTGTATYNDEVMTTFTVDVAPYMYAPSLYPVARRTLANDTWAQIAEISASGNAYMCYRVGDEKAMTLTDGQEITMRIIGFNHDSLSDGTGFAGITFESSNLPTGYYKYATSNYSTAASWGTSVPRAALQPNGAIYELIPTEVKSIIKPVNKLYRYNVAGDNVDDIIFSSDYCFALSMSELGYIGVQSTANEGAVYAFYIGKSDSYYIKNLGGTAADYWTRSCQAYEGTANKQFYSRGAGGASSIGSPTYQKPIPIAFCV